jgi:hypothetical protein
MLSAIMLLNTERDKTNKVAESLADLTACRRSVRQGSPTWRRSYVPATTTSSPPVTEKFARARHH